MSLDVYLNDPQGKRCANAEPRIFIREDGQQKEISRAEWDERFPGREPVTVLSSNDEEDHCVYHANITHNLGKMAGAAEIYYPLWQPEECGITHARQLIQPLREGLGKLRRDPAYFQEFNPSNGWGTYEGLVRFVEAYIAACEAHPQAEVSVSR